MNWYMLPFSPLVVAVVVMVYLWFYRRKPKAEPTTNNCPKCGNRMDFIQLDWGTACYWACFDCDRIDT